VQLRTILSRPSMNVSALTRRLRPLRSILDTSDPPRSRMVPDAGLERSQPFSSGDVGAKRWTRLVAEGALPPLELPWLGRKHRNEAISIVTCSRAYQGRARREARDSRRIEHHFVLSVQEPLEMGHCSRGTSRDSSGIGNQMLLSQRPQSRGR